MNLPIWIQQKPASADKSWKADRMSKQKPASADKSLVKIGHAVTPAAQSLLAMMADLDGVPESVLIETCIRANFDARPPAHQTALSTLLRAKGHSIRDLRKSNAAAASADNPADDASLGQGRGGTPAPAPPAPPATISNKIVPVDTENVVPGLERRTEMITQTWEKSVAPYDHVLAKHGESDLA